ncbi:hypothetical protein Bbelb_246010 [Branchiostoma belcheri]|nr:hypothetical protein Bbelb_246010 [Branchiostoma belcheri]
MNRLKQSVFLGCVKRHVRLAQQQAKEQDNGVKEQHLYTLVEDRGREALAFSGGGTLLRVGDGPSVRRQPDNKAVHSRPLPRRVTDMFASRERRYLYSRLPKPGRGQGVWHLGQISVGLRAGNAPRRARGVFSVPWVEIEGASSIACTSAYHSSNITSSPRQRPSEKCSPLQNFSRGRKLLSKQRLWRNDR